MGRPALNRCTHCKEPLITGRNRTPAQERHQSNLCMHCANTAQKQWRDRQSASWRMVRRAKRRATDNSLPFDLREEDIVIPETCPVLGIELISGEGSSQDNSPSLDRKIPELGYTRGNVAVISHKANRMKNNATLAELEALVAWLKG